MTEEILRVEKLSKRYGKFWALRELSFSVRAGEIVGFLGQNGAGKSTAIKILCNLIRPTEGQAYLNGQPITGTSRSEHRSRLGAIVEAPRFYPQLSGRTNLELIARIRCVPRERVDALLEQVGLTGREWERFGRYSMGMKQRLGLAAVLLHQPSLIILDEPTNGLDPAGMNQIQELIASLQKQHGVSVLLCSHQLDEVAALCQRALVLHEGRLLLEQPLTGPEGIQAVRQIFANLAHQASVN
jgi:ABC-2 type transport system ATP-binding protein